MRLSFGLFCWENAHRWNITTMPHDVTILLSPHVAMASSCPRQDSASFVFRTQFINCIYQWQLHDTSYLLSLVIFFFNVKYFEYSSFLFFKLLQAAYICSYEHNYMHYFHYSFSQIKWNLKKLSSLLFFLHIFSSICNACLSWVMQT